MAQRVDQRDPTRAELDAYNKCLKLSSHVMSVCKPRENKPNNHHIPKRNLILGRLLMEAVVDLGADILDANMVYVGGNLAKEDRLRNYRTRIGLQDHAKRLTFRMEHIIRILNEDHPFAESTLKYMVDLLCETRNLISAWRESDIKASKQLRK